MSTERAAAGVMCCANCGIAGVDEIKLEECDGCDLVKYCSDKCKEDHREQHHEECKKRADELHDDDLFTQPDGTHRGECPICFLPLPLEGKSAFMSCCGKTICCGCIFANYLTNRHSRCAFCRTSAFDDKECETRTQERIEVNHPTTLCHVGAKCFEAGDYDKALEYWTKAAGLGDVEAHSKLGNMYCQGDGVEEDEEKAVYHWEKATIGGHPQARHNLAVYEKGNGRLDRAVKHWIISANLGYDRSMKALLPRYKDGYITKEEYGATLRAHQAAIDAMKSAEREAAYALFCKRAERGDD